VNARRCDINHRIPAAINNLFHPTAAVKGVNRMPLR